MSESEKIATLPRIYQYKGRRDWDDFHVSISAQGVLFINGAPSTEKTIAEFLHQPSEITGLDGSKIRKYPLGEEGWIRQITEKGGRVFWDYLEK